MKKLLQKRLFSPLLAGGAGLAVLLLLVAWAVGGEAGEASAKPGRWVAAQPRSFDLYVHERGHVSPARVVPIASSISSDQAQLQWLYPEGKQVNRGLIIARFDTKPFEDAKHRAEQEHADAEARLAAAEKALSLQEEEEKGKLEAAKQGVEIARLKLDETENGTGKLKQRILKQKLKEGRRKLEKLRRELADFDALLDKGHVSRRERDDVEDNYINARESVELAEAELENYRKYEYQRQLSEARVGLKKARSDLERTKKTSELEIQRSREAVIKYRRDLDVVSIQLAQARTDLENCIVRAPIDGTLLYKSIPRGSGERKPRIGDNIWFKQAFMEIPDTSKMVVEVNVREVDVAQLRPGMPVRIELDAFPGRQFKGSLDSVESVARDGGSALRRFHALIDMTDADAAISAGMSADAKIHYRHLQDVLTVPVTALVYADGQPQVRVKRQGEVVSQVVGVGAIGGDWAEVVSGLTAGESVEANPL